MAAPHDTPYPALLSDGDGRTGTLEILRQTAADLERVGAELDEMARVVSQELREPLRMVSNYIELLSRRYGPRLDADATEFLTYVGNSAHRMQELLDDLLEYSAVVHNMLVRRPCDSRAVLDNALSVLEPLVHEAEATIQIGPMPEVMADTRHLGRLFVNLMDNAIKYRHPQRAPCVKISGAEVGGGWQFQVSDNGESVPPGECDRIFMVFQRLHGSELPGTGLGLSICKRIVERHGGRIWVEPRPGLGSIFHFTLLRRGS